eukprot:COSAG06_NODE_44083_length_366_cov_0.940075_1_plen_52_part_10
MGIATIFVATGIVLAFAVTLRAAVAASVPQCLVQAVAGTQARQETILDLICF